MNVSPRIWLAGVALTLPLSVSAAPDDLSRWSEQRGDPAQAWLLSEVVGDDVIAARHTKIGEVVDVLMADDGAIESLVVFSDGTRLERGHRKIAWPVQRFDPSKATISIAEAPASLGNRPTYASPEDSVAKNQYLASQLTGMDVQVEGEAYGEIVDLVVDGEARVQSLILGPNGVDTPDYWIPIDFGWISDARMLIVPYAQTDITDADNRPGWDID